MVVLPDSVEQLEEEAMIRVRSEEDFSERQQRPEHQQNTCEPVRVFHTERMAGTGYTRVKEG